MMQSARRALTVLRVPCLAQSVHGKNIHSSVVRCKAQILDGRRISNEILTELRGEIETWSAAGYRRPHLNVIMVGSNPASVSYVRNKLQAAKSVGVASDTIRLPESISQSDLICLIESLNTDQKIDGILVQLPLPSHMSERTVCDAVSPEKDVDGFHVKNVGHMCQGKDGLYPCTPMGVMELLRRSGIKTFGKNAVICGRSKNVGMPLMMLMHADGYGDATTTICHRYTPPDQLRVFTKTADILVVAVGKPGLVTADMVKDGVVVVDVGITRRWDVERNCFVLKGDVDFDSVSEKASFITPVPGGVGPMTVCMLIKNTFAAARKLRGYDANLDFRAANDISELNLDFTRAVSNDFLAHMNLGS